MILLKRLWYQCRRRLVSSQARTIRHTFSFSFIALLALSAAALLYDNESYIRIATDARSISANEAFTISVFAGAHTSVNAVDISLQFPTDRVSVSGIDIGESVISIWTEDPYVDGDVVILRGGTFRRGFIGEHLIAKVNFRALESGVADFSINELTLLAGDGSGTPVKTARKASESLVVIVQNEDGSISADVEVVFVTDIDGDGDVSLADVQTFMQAWFRKEYIYDFNQDNRMDFTDFAIILADSFFQ